MAKGGSNQKSNGSKFSKSYNVSNSFVTKVASRVSDYLGGWFGTPLKSCSDAEASETAPTRAPEDAAVKPIFENVEPRRSTFLSHRVFDSVDALSSPAKRFKVSDKDRVDIDFPISPIPSTSGLYRETVNHAFEVPGVPGPSDPRRDKFGRTTNDVGDVAPQRVATTDVKANGATDNHSDSSESTSGCSSLVPQSDRLSQSAYVCSTRKRNLEEKLKYARQLQQSRTSLYLNRSIPVKETSGARKKPSFDVTVYGSPALDKTTLRDRLINSPFYTGQTSYGGASAYRLSRNTFYSQRNPRFTTERREGLQVQVKPSHHGSTEDLSNMSHTAKKILEALEQFSTPVNDAKRIPVNRSSVPLGLKRRRFDDMPETRLRLSTPISPLNPNPGPVITGLNVPTVPDLLKLKRLERIQDSTSAARQVAVQKQEYSLPSEVSQEKRTGKIMTKLKDREKNVSLEKLEEVNLPKIPLPITTLPKFDFQLPSVRKPAEDKTDATETPKTRNFVFSPPIAVSVKELPEKSAQKNSFKFSNPLNPDEKISKPEKTIAEPVVNFKPSDTVSKLKRKSISDETVKAADTPSLVVKPPPPEPSKPSQNGFGDLFKKQANQWECSVCMIRNKDTDSKCVACETPKPGSKNEKAEQKSSFGSGSLGCGFKFGIDKAGGDDGGVKSAADSSTFQTQANGPHSQSKPSQFGSISTSVGVFTFGIPPAQNKKEEPKKEVSKPAQETTSNFLVTSTSGSILQKDEPLSENRSEPEKAVETKVDKESDSAKVETVKPFTFGIPNKSPVKPVLDSESEVKPSNESKSSNLFFSANSNSNTLETVSSSTTDLVLAQNKTTADQSMNVGDAGSSKSPTNFQFKPFTPPEMTSPKPNLQFSVDKKTETVPSTSAAVVTTFQSFTSSVTSPSSIFNASKMIFGTSSTSSVGSGLGIGNTPTSNATLFGAPVPSFTTSGFGSQNSAAPSTSSFGIMPQSTEKPALSTGISFGSPSASMPTAPNPFASAATSAQNQETPKSFGPFGTNSGMSNFGNSAPTFGTGFAQSSTTSEKPAATPFIFGSSAPAPASSNTSCAAPLVTAPGVFTFGAPKPDPKPVFSFGQSAAPSFSFGSSANAPNVFGGFGQPKTENSLGATSSPFGSSATSMFGQSSAPVAPKFDFGNSAAQQQGTSPSVFQFGATPAQPASAPAGAGFSLSVPQKFDFTGGQPAVFSASPGADLSSALRGRTRKVIKAVRRTTRDPTRRPQ